ncbi:unnamed protein product [Cylindrotheca closterium]|uniref:Uncharacterized protein n=1 Tax=Cylindrotheca closterium TaxID=2856 RepID=A0AAD2GA42_9STRA|nr:unnamed protein product [Cylindrotheca closterium]
MTTTAQGGIFGPFLIMQLLTIAVWFYMYFKRIPFLFGYVEKHKGEMTMDDIGDPKSRHFITNITPDSVRNPSDNLKNLFEVPILFYAMVFYLYATEKVDTGYLTAAWIFAILRCVHSVIQSTFNNITLRFQVYAFSCFALFYMVLRASIAHFL